jgi:hypothetical protein
MLYLTNGPQKASWLKADERVWLIDRLSRERPVREAHGKHTLWRRWRTRAIKLRRRVRHPREATNEVHVPLRQPAARRLMG